MDIFYHEKFKRQFKKLDRRVKELAYEREAIFLKNPFDPRLKTHKLHGALADYWTISVDNRHRIILKFMDSKTAKFYEIGDHSIYE